MVGTLLEVLRLLAAGPQLQNTVIVNFNGGEESGLVGAMAFAEHPWRKQVKVVLNSDAGGSGGKAMLFQTTPGNDRWVEAYARAAPHPYATSVGEELLRVQRMPSDTDFRIYRTQAELTGFDFALYQDGYSYHTPLDVERGSPRAASSTWESTCCRWSARSPPRSSPGRRPPAAWATTTCSA